MTDGQVKLLRRVGVVGQYPQGDGDGDAQYDGDGDGDDDDAQDEDNDGWTGEAIEACWGGWSSAQSRELVRSCRNVITNIEEKYGSKKLLRITVEKYSSKMLLKIVLSN